MISQATKEHIVDAINSLNAALNDMQQNSLKIDMKAWKIIDISSENLQDYLKSEAA